LECLKVLHPVEREIVRLRVDFVEDDYEGKFGLVEYTACIEHIRHKCRRGRGTWCVDDVCDDSRERRRDCVCDNGTRRRPRKNLDLTWGVYDHIVNRLCTLLDEIKHLIEFCGEEIERGEDSAVWAQVVPLGGQPQLAVVRGGRAHCFMTSW
jgi:hypothetical protein